MLIFSIYTGKLNWSKKIGNGIHRIKAAMQTVEKFESEFNIDGFFTISLYRPISI